MNADEKEKKEYTFFASNVKRSNTKNRDSVRPRKTRRVVQILVGCVLGLIFIGTVFFIVGTREAARVVVKPTTEAFKNFSTSLELFNALDPERAQLYLNQNREALDTTNRELATNPINSFLQLLDTTVPAINSTGGIISSMLAVNTNFITLISTLDVLSQQGFYNLAHDGASLLSLFDVLHKVAGEIVSQLQNIKNTTTQLSKIAPPLSQLDQIIGESYVEQSTTFYSLEQFIAAVRDLIGNSEERHIAVIFDDTQILRPGGGTVFAYADAVVKNGQLQRFIVHDTHDKEVIAPQIEPPQPLGSFVKQWSLADAFWSFHFPASAEAARYFIEKDVRFDGIIAVSSEVVRSLIAVVGPIKLSDDVIITRENFNTVGVMDDNFKKLLPVLFEKLEKLDSATGKALLQTLGVHVVSRDIRIAMYDPIIAEFLSEIGVDGSVYMSNEIFSGNYFGISEIDALTHAEVGDANVKATMSITMHNDGHTTTDLTLHGAENRRGKQTVFQLFTNDNSELAAVSGHQRITTVSNVLPNSELQESISSLKTLTSRTLLSNFGIVRGTLSRKTYYEITQSIPSKQPIIVRYETPIRGSKTLVDGAQYVFVVERSPGLELTMTVTVVAPLGYVWEEVGKSSFVYELPSNVGQHTLQLTLRTRST